MVLLNSFCMLLLQASAIQLVPTTPDGPSPVTHADEAAYTDAQNNKNEEDLRHRDLSLYSYPSRVVEQPQNECNKVLETRKTGRPNNLRYLLITIDAGTIANVHVCNMDTTITITGAEFLQSNVFPDSNQSKTS